MELRGLSACLTYRKSWIESLPILLLKGPSMCLISVVGYCWSTISHCSNFQMLILLLIAHLVVSQFSQDFLIHDPSSTCSAMTLVPRLSNYIFSSWSFPSSSLSPSLSLLPLSTLRSTYLWKLLFPVSLLGKSSVRWGNILSNLVKILNFINDRTSVSLCHYSS